MMLRAAARATSVGSRPLVVVVVMGVDERDIGGVVWGCGVVESRAAAGVVDRRARRAAAGVERRGARVGVDVMADPCA
jgi:hypothetical protein